MIAGRIIPAIATTTAMTCGCVSFEIYKFAQDIKDTKLFRNGFYNLAVNYFLFLKPSRPRVMKDKKFDEDIQGPLRVVKPDNKNFPTPFDKIVINGPMTIQELINNLNSTYKVLVDTVLVGGNETEVYLYEGLSKKKEHAPRLD